MSAHETNNLLRYGSIAGGCLIFLFLIAGMKSCSHSDEKASAVNTTKTTAVKNMASGDSEAESLDTLTADLNATKKQIEQVVRDNNDLRQSNALLQSQLNGQKASTTTSGSSSTLHTSDQASSSYPIHNSTADASTSSKVDTGPATLPSAFDTRNATHIAKAVDMGKAFNFAEAITQPNEKPKPIPYYTIPPNATAIHDRLMTALVGRVPVKGVVTDPYPFKIVFSDDTLAANGLRVPHLKQMIVSGFTEGDLTLKTVRGWVTSLTFVFEDGTISSVSSNDNNIGKFTKENALGYLTDQYGNPIQGALITNAPAYLATKVGLGVASGFATAYSQNQVNNQTNAFGGSTSTVTGSPFKFMLGQGAASGANQAQSWFDDRAENSFDAIYVPTVDQNGSPVEISVNFAKQIDINYDPTGRKISYEHDENTNHVNADLD